MSALLPPRMRDVPTTTVSPSDMLNDGIDQRRAAAPAPERSLVLPRLDRELGVGKALTKRVASTAILGSAPAA